jgi:hypothetical protein
VGKHRLGSDASDAVCTASEPNRSCYCCNLNEKCIYNKPIQTNMRKLTLTLLCVFSAFAFAFCQDENSRVDAPLGLRVKRNGQDYLIYADKNFAPNFKDFRKINYQVYFRKVDFPVKEVNGKKYQLITIPGSSKEQDQNDNLKVVNGEPVYPRAGKTINKEDYDLNFWIELEVLEKNIDTEYYKYANDVFSGLLTAPFKYRLKSGDAPESLIDGDFNVAPFLGWKWRISSVRPFYIAPFIFTGITTLDYNSANNSKISDPEKLENGAGITYGLGLSLRLGTVSPGFIIGKDHALGDLGKGFLYSNKPWVSFSLNFDFFKPQKTAEGQK